MTDVGRERVGGHVVSDGRTEREAGRGRRHDVSTGNSLTHGTAINRRQQTELEIWGKTQLEAVRRSKSD